MKSKSKSCPEALETAWALAISMPTQVIDACSVMHSGMAQVFCAAKATGAPVQHAKFLIHACYAGRL